ncbi:hypothetical protein [Xanthomonas vasicola]|uniref:hypothetical protein n=1 Tax=Xanthomonas vasicola TaxID=56459 RepID=UPI000530FB2B|nr:hypothetical protein [Xanthomonas vasicola]AZR37116.1 hypothetical protein NX08_022060 [Xanthomonas vasicola]KGR50478.1 hypothetical protein NX07_16550 [Xanthomonas vasicola]KGR50895.1 hypothetical protein NX09_20175 [Xanthomonas vasicola]KGT82823.1 hypothetical protein OC00_17105 [Xanthomonas vasicola]
MEKLGSKYVLGACIIGSVFSAAAATQSAGIDAAGRVAAMSAWEATLRQDAPAMEGCFRSSFPNNGWQAVRCAPPPKVVSRPPAIAHRKDGSITARTEGTMTVGNGVDYAARTGSRTRSAVGSFPAVNGVTTGVEDYSLQINTNRDKNSVTCVQFGYTSCETWQQFIYATDDDGDPSNGRTPVAFIQDWFFADSTAEYKAKGCPGGWHDYPEQDACYTNSYGVEAPLVPVSKIDSIQLSGSATAGSVDTVMFSINGQAYSVSQNAHTLNINKIWRLSEFNIFGNGSDAPLVSFNSGSQVTVKVAVDDGTRRSPTCLGPNAGQTFEQNNLTLGSCTASGGASPAITFTQSN